MALSQQTTLEKEDRTAGYEGGLARSLVRTLLIFTFVPLIIMAGSAYLRSRPLLREQVVGQMQAQLNNQLSQMDSTVKTKEIRMDRLARGAGRAAEIEAAVRAGPDSLAFARLRDQLAADLRAVDAGTGHATFNQFFFAANDGRIRMASRPDWEKASIRESSFYPTLTVSQRESFLLYDLTPLYPKQLVLATVSKVTATSGDQLGILVGITEAPDLQATLTGLAALNPESAAFYITQDGMIVGRDAYTDQLGPVTLPQEQHALLEASLRQAMDP